MKAVSDKEFAKVLEKYGWTCKRITGSHHIYVKAGSMKVISIPVHANKPLKIGLLRVAMKTAELTENDL